MSNFNKMTGRGLTTKCESCGGIIYRIKIVEEDSPIIRTAKLKKEQVKDIGYYARVHESKEVILFGPENKVKGGSGSKPVPKADLPITNYVIGSLKSITYHPSASPIVRIYCPVCSATARWQRSDRSSEVNIFCRHCQLQFRAETIDNRPLANVLLNKQEYFLLMKNFVIVIFFRRRKSWNALPFLPAGIYVVH